MRVLAGAAVLSVAAGTSGWVGGREAEPLTGGALNSKFCNIDRVPAADMTAASWPPAVLASLLLPPVPALCLPIDRQGRMVARG